MNTNAPPKPVNPEPTPQPVDPEQRGTHPPAHTHVPQPERESEHPKQP